MAKWSLVFIIFFLILFLVYIFGSWKFLWSDLSHKFMIVIKKRIGIGRVTFSLHDFKKCLLFLIYIDQDIYVYCKCLKVFCEII